MKQPAARVKKPGHFPWTRSDENSIAQSLRSLAVLLRCATSCDMTALSQPPALPKARPRRWTGWAGVVLLLGLVLLMSPFVRHAFVFGWNGLTTDLSGQERLYRLDAMASNGAIFVHMIGGAALTLMAPLQLIAPLRARLPGLHRWSGRGLVILGAITAVGGLAYIALRGTIGGWVMDLGFGLYGALVLVASAQVIRHARAGDRHAHRAWGLRFFWLAIGSWIYRVHYGLWYLATDGAGSAPDFSGMFDLVQTFAFYLPYLLLLEVYLRRKPKPS